VACVAVAAGEEISAGGDPGKSSIICLFINVYIYIWIAIHIERGRGDRVAFVTAASRKLMPYWRVSRY